MPFLSRHLKCLPLPGWWRRNVAVCVPHIEAQVWPSWLHCCYEADMVDSNIYAVSSLHATTFCLSAKKEFMFRLGNDLVFVRFCFFHAWPHSAFFSSKKESVRLFSVWFSIFFMTVVYIERTMVYIVDELVYIEKINHWWDGANDWWCIWTDV